MVFFHSYDVEILINYKVLAKHRAYLTRRISSGASDLRSLTTGQVIFVLTMHAIETMRSAAGLPSSLVSYFTNSSLNKQNGLNICMDAVADNVCSLFQLARAEPNGANR